MKTKSSDSKSILFITAHPDDETVSTGTFMRAGSNGWNNYIYHMTPGKNGKLNDGESNDSVLENRQTESYVFANAVGAVATFYDNDKQLLSVDDDVVISLVRYLRVNRPNIIIVLHEFDYHFEHRVSRDIALTAIEIAARSAMLELGQKITDFVILETDGLCPLRSVDITINISNIVTEKEAVVSGSYGARLGNYLQNYDRGLSQMRGERLGYAYAESYALVRPPWYQFTSDRLQILVDFSLLSNV